MIRIEKPEFRGQCNCCFSLDNVKEIHFMSGAYSETLKGYSGTIVALCVKCRNELEEELKRHG